MSTAAELPLDFAITTDRCLLRAPREADFPAMFEATREPGFCDGMKWNAPVTPEELVGPYRRLLASWQAGDEFCFSIELTSDAEFVGRISIRQSAEAGLWTIGYWLHPRYQRHGLMTEAAMAVLHFGFELLGATEIDARYAIWNRKSERVLHRIGMTFVEHLPYGLKKNGRWIPENRVSRHCSSWPRFTGN